MINTEKKIRTFFLVFLFLLHHSFLFAQAPKLSPQAEISLLTCAPGKALYEAFGHSALRAHDPAQQIDFSFNYGTFDFNQPNFYGNFIKGNQMYMLAVSTT